MSTNPYYNSMTTAQLAREAVNFIRIFTPMIDIYDKEPGHPYVRWIPIDLATPIEDLPVFEKCAFKALATYVKQFDPRGNFLPPKYRVAMPMTPAHVFADAKKMIEQAGEYRS